MVIVFTARELRMNKIVADLNVRMFAEHAQPINDELRALISNNVRDTVV